MSFAGYQDVAEGRCVVRRLSRYILVTIDAFFAGYHDVGDGR